MVRSCWTRCVPASGRYDISRETQYVQWIRRFILFSGKRHPRNMGIVEVEAFLTHLAVEGSVSASTQNQALAAPLFLYREVLGINLPGLKDVVRARAFSYLLYGHSRVGRESLPIANGHPSAPGMTVCDWSAEAALPDTTSRPSVFVGKGLPTYECLNQFTRAEGANDVHQAGFAVRAR
ncbi:phage integrase N-terminal SAM-like domain-containing protein [Methylocaldum gracile subsp. desertum]|uniref:phage integrase N-terminal SAM-like domain-containing protein n=1 Tax=Methylocaldum sp. GT1BW TaxID=3438964 RepID=UPI003DA148A8